MTEMTAPTHQTARHPPHSATAGARLNIAAPPSGTHVAQIPMGTPRVSGGNHHAITVGATTVTNPRPIPSIARPNNRTSKRPASAPVTAPTATAPIAIAPAVRAPSHCRM
jgi:hypothetical protein